MIVNVSEAKTNLSKLIDRVYHGEKVVIAKNNLPVADLVRHKPTGKRKLGVLRGTVQVPADFTEEDNAINEMFYGRPNGTPA
ncbi:MAG: type II toxin-antitoxin system prevent-host-death family antitoxin [Kiritimatiellae bacterium]|nr:type II toxin-antitoxin system prevent-host-death family antitoxin [Kiritimatiellia bacterium]